MTPSATASASPLPAAVRSQWAPAQSWLRWCGPARLAQASDQAPWLPAPARAPGAGSAAAMSGLLRVPPSKRGQCVASARRQRPSKVGRILGISVLMPVLTTSP